MLQERLEVLLGVRVTKRIHAKLLTEQERIAKATGIKPTINRVARMLIEKGLNGKRKR